MMALIGEALWQDVNEEFEMLVLELQRVAREVEELVLKQSNIVLNCKQ
jgi:hypothetical protein